MASFPETSLSIRDLVGDELRDLAAESEALDAEIADLRARVAAEEVVVEIRKAQLIAGARDLKLRQLEASAAEMETMAVEEKLAAAWKASSEAAEVAASMMTEEAVLNKEISWVAEDLERIEAESKEEEERRRIELERSSEWKAKVEAEAKLAEIEDKLAKIESGATVEPSLSPETIERMETETRVMAKKNEAYLRRMRSALKDLDAQATILSNKIERMRRND